MTILMGQMIETMKFEDTLVSGPNPYFTGQVMVIDYGSSTMFHSPFADPLKITSIVELGRQGPTPNSRQGRTVSW